MLNDLCVQVLNLTQFLCSLVARLETLSELVIPTANTVIMHGFSLDLLP